jgi:hypothetical protein
MARLFGVGLVATASGGFETQVKAYCVARLRFAELRFSPHTAAARRPCVSPPARRPKRRELTAGAGRLACA